jgi:hypothetical protein
LSGELPSILLSSDSLKRWLNYISGKSQLSNMPTSSVELLALILSAILTRSLSMEYKGLIPHVFQGFSTLAKSKPSISPSLLPLFLYFLPLLPSPMLKLTLLQSLPSLATHKFSVGPTANVLRSLAGNAYLLPLSLSLLGKLWIEHDSVFPHVVSLLVQTKVPASIASEFDIARAVVIKDICCIRGEQHGEDMLGHISLILKHSKVSLAVALVTEALAALCQCDTIDPVTVWSVFGEQLFKNQSLPVAVASCSLLSLAAGVDSEQRHAAKHFKDSALRLLWQMVFSKSPEICSAALGGLSHFSTSDFHVEHLPPEAPPAETCASDLFTVSSEEAGGTLLPAGYCIHLVTAITPESLPALSRFLSSLLPQELEAIPRGLVSSAVKQAQTPSSLERGVRGVENTLYRMCLANAEKDTRHGMVASTSLMLNGMISPTDCLGPRDRGHTATREMKKYSSLLEESLQNGTICLELDNEVLGGGVECGVSCLVLPQRWVLFMKKVFDSFTKAWLVRNCPASIWEDSPALEEKTLKARDW